MISYDIAVAVTSTTRNIDARALHDRCPSVDDVLTEVKSMPTVQQFFNNSRHFTKKSDPDLFFNEHDLWSTVSEKLMSAISKYTPIDEKDAEKKTKLYEVEKEKMIDFFIGKYELFPLADDGTHPPT